MTLFILHFRFIRNISTFQHLTFGVALKAGCGFDDSYIAANPTNQNDVVVIDTRKNTTGTVYTIVRGYDRPKQFVFVGKYSPRRSFMKKSKAQGVLYNPELILLLQMLFAILFA